MFTLIVDDIGIKVFNDDDLQHLISTIWNKWEVKVDRTGAKYNGVRLIWTYSDNTLTNDVPNYVAEALARLNLPDIRPRFAPAPYTPPPYGRDQTPPDPLDSVPVTPEEVKIIQRIHGIFLYHSFQGVISLLMSPVLSTS